MKRDYNIYERRQSAGRMEVVLLAASFIGFVASVFILLFHGWLMGFFACLLSLMAFALASVFKLLGDMLGCLGQIEAGTRPGPAETKTGAA